MNIDDHIWKVERYGFRRRLFPSTFYGHKLEILSNDAYIQNDGRLLFDLTLRCLDCGEEYGVSGRFKHKCDDQMNSIVAAKLICLGHFYETDCASG
jgi:hypothetical protein